MFSKFMQRCKFIIPCKLPKKHFSTTSPMTVREGLTSGIKEEMERDDSVFLIGEEVAQYNGAYKISKGLYDQFGKDRVIDTPITEMGFTGMAVGSAMSGLRPICEFMSFNFSLQAIDHIINSAAKIRYMSAGRIKVPIVFRGPNAAAAGVGAQHSQDFTPWYSSVPGLKVFSIYDTEDARGCLKAAIRDDNPVVLLENELLYGQSFDVDDSIKDKDFVVPFGKARFMRKGNDITIVAYSRMIEESIKASKILLSNGINAEIINLRSVRPYDAKSIIESVKKTNHLIIVEESWPQCGMGGEICGLMMDTKTFYYLDAPVERVTGADIPMAYASNLEKLSTPTFKDILRACERSLGVKIKVEN